MSKKDKQIQREIRRLREQDRKKNLFQKQPEELSFEEQLQAKADEINKALEFLFEQKLVRVGSSTKMQIQGEAGETSYLLLMFPSSVWTYANSKLSIKVEKNDGGI